MPVLTEQGAGRGVLESPDPLSRTSELKHTHTMRLIDESALIVWVALRFVAREPEQDVFERADANHSFDNNAYTIALSHRKTFSQVIQGTSLKK